MASSTDRNPSVVDDVFSIIASQTGVSKSDLAEIEDFADLGIDNILEKSIVSEVKNSLHFDLPPNALRDYPNTQDLTNCILKSLQTTKASKASAGPPSSNKSTPSKSLSNGRISSNKGSHVQSTTPQSPLSILLQGNPATSSKTIFLLPDGSGSGMAYARLPRISQDICLIGMNSPYLSTPADFTVTIENLAREWVSEIRSRQPTGPYILGGWSAGGYYSYEVTKLLQQEGEVITKLILIDSPCRLEFEALPVEVIRYLSEHNLVGPSTSKKTPDWFVNHFASTIEAVRNYMPAPIEPSDQPLPDVYLILASDGVMQNFDTSKTGLNTGVKVTKYLLEQRKDFGPHGWEKLLPGANMSFAVMPGNHFTIVHPPDCTSLSQLIGDTLEDDGSKRVGKWHVVD